MLTRRDFNRTLVAGGAALVTSEGVGAASPQGGASGANPAEPYDLLIKGGTVVDPSQKLHGPMDVAVKDAKIAAVAANIPAERGRSVISAKDRIVTPGLVDIHVHCFDGVGTGTNADRFCLGRGVTTVVDAGSVGYPMIDAFDRYVVRQSLTRIRALVDIGGLGTIVGVNDVMKNLNWVNPELAAKAANEQKPLAVGIKVRLQQSIEGNNDVECLKRALQAAEATKLPLMAHIDDPYSPMQDLVKMLRKGDIVTHYLNGHPHGVLDANGKIWPEVLDARQRGVIFDPAQGSSHFDFDVAEKTLQQGFVPDTISTDLTTGSEFAPVHDLPTQVSKFMATGIDLDRAIAMATVNTADLFDYGASIGTLKPGMDADIAIFELRDGNFTFTDTEHKNRSGHQMLVNKVAIRHGRVLVNEY